MWVGFRTYKKKCHVFGYTTQQKRCEFFRYVREEASVVVSLHNIWRRVVLFV